MSHPGAFDVFGKTERGTATAVNEDQFLIAQLQASLLLSHSSLQLDDVSALEPVNRDLDRLVLAVRRR